MKLNISKTVVYRGLISHAGPNGEWIPPIAGEAHTLGV